MRKLGLIAGGGSLPVELAQHCEAAGRPFAVMRLRSFAQPVLARYPGVEVGLGEFGKVFKALRAEGCEVVCFAGVVDRPDFAAIKPDLRGLTVIPAWSTPPARATTPCCAACWPSSRRKASRSRAPTRCGAR
jgi:DUF1009 family protein